MRFCQECGNPSPETAAYCSNCGVKLAPTVDITEREGLIGYIVSGYLEWKARGSSSWRKGASGLLFKTDQVIVFNVTPNIPLPYEEGKYLVYSYAYWGKNSNMDAQDRVEATRLAELMEQEVMLRIRREEVVGMVLRKPRAVMGFGKSGNLTFRTPQGEQKVRLEAGMSKEELEILRVFCMEFCPEGFYVE